MLKTGFYKNSSGVYVLYIQVYNNSGMLSIKIYKQGIFIGGIFKSNDRLCQELLESAYEPSLPKEERKIFYSIGRIIYANDMGPISKEEFNLDTCRDILLH